MPDVVVGVGIDLVDPRRIGAALRRTPGLARRILTPTEHARLVAGDADVDGVAAAFAAKEAVMKALGAGMSSIRFAHICTERSSGPDWVALGGVALRDTARRRAEDLGIVRVDLGRPGDGEVPADLIGATAIAWTAEVL